LPGNGTPVEGVPIPDGDVVPDVVDNEDTGPLSTRMMAAVGDVGAMEAQGDGDPEAFLDALATKLAQKSGGGGGPPPKKFLGLDGGAWTKLLIGYLIAAAVGVFLWWLAVRDGLNERPTRPEVQETIKTTLGGALDRHENDRAHPKAQRQIDEIKVEQRTIRESQIRQEGIDKTQTETLKEIKDDVKRIRRRDR
jgi:hypothetical protein